MKHYRIAFLGLGSIGRRHLLNVCHFLNNRGDLCSIDLYRSDISKPLDKEVACHVSMQYLYSEGIACGVGKYDVIFVTNPTSLHYESIKRFYLHTKSFFVEKPIFSSTEIDDSFFKAISHVLVYVACPLRYNPVLQYIKKNIPYKEAYSVRAISSSFLPNWRPGLDYRKSYSAHREMGGGVGIDLIHEWDYLTYFFGIPKLCFNIQDKISDLEIDSDDIAIYIAKAGKTTVELHLDYFGTKTIRTLELFLPKETICCDIVSGKIVYQTSGEVYNVSVERNDYQMLEIKHFFDIFDGKIENDSDVNHAYQILKLAKGEI